MTEKEFEKAVVSEFINLEATSDSKPIDELIEKYEEFLEAIESVYSVAKDNPIIRTMAKDMKDLAIKWINEFIKDLQGLREPNIK